MSEKLCRQDYGRARWTCAEIGDENAGQTAVIESRGNAHGALRLPLESTAAPEARLTSSNVPS